MAYRKRMSRGKSRRVFKKTAMRTRRRNHPRPMRGGYRL
jgi:hypothetical protein